MLRVLERYGPRSPRARAIAATVFGSVGFTALFMVVAHLFAIQYQFTEDLTLLLTSAVGLVFTALAYWEAERVVSRAEAAPEPTARPVDRSRDRPADEDADDPVAALQHRYAEGELSTDEFEERVDRLVETDHRVEEADVADLELDRA